MLVRLDRTSTDGPPDLVVEVAKSSLLSSRAGDFKHSSSSSIMSLSEPMVDDVDSLVRGLLFIMGMPDLRLFLRCLELIAVSYESVSELPE